MSSLTLLSALCSSLERLVRFQLGKSVCASSASLNRQIERQSNENKSSKHHPGDIGEKSDRVGFNAFFTCRGLCLRLRSNRGADRRYRNAFVRFIERRGIIELRHLRFTRMMQRHDFPAVFVEHWTAGASAFGWRPVVHASVIAPDHDVVVEGERKPASAGMANDVQPLRPLGWWAHRQRFVCKREPRQPREEASRSRGS